MVSIEEAQRTILDSIHPLETEKVTLFQLLNRVTPEDHIAPWDIPPADNSAMDGYAFSHAALTGNLLRVTGFLPAGRQGAVPVRPGEAVKIMTGAPLPPGCDTVAPIEDVADDGEFIRLAAQVLDAGGDPLLPGIAPDTLGETCEKIRAGLNADIVVITGGVSVGDRDLIRLTPETSFTAGDGVEVILLDRGFEMGSL